MTTSQVCGEEGTVGEVSRGASRASTLCREYSTERALCTCHVALYMTCCTLYSIEEACPSENVRKLTTDNNQLLTLAGDGHLSLIVVVVTTKCCRCDPPDPVQWWSIIVTILLSCIIHYIAKLRDHSYTVYSTSHVIIWYHSS